MLHNIPMFEPALPALYFSSLIVFFLPHISLHHVIPQDTVYSLSARIKKSMINDRINTCPCRSIWDVLPLVISRSLFGVSKSGRRRRRGGDVSISGPPLPPVTMTTAVDGGGWGGEGGGGGGSLRSLDRCCWGLRIGREMVWQDGSCENTYATPP